MINLEFEHPNPDALNTKLNRASPEKKPPPMTVYSKNSNSKKATHSKQDNKLRDEKMNEFFALFGMTLAEAQQIQAQRVQSDKGAKSYQMAGSDINQIDLILKANKNRGPGKTQPVFAPTMQAQGTEISLIGRPTTVVPVKEQKWEEPEERDLDDPVLLGLQENRQMNNNSSQYNHQQRIVKGPVKNQKMAFQKKPEHLDKKGIKIGEKNTENPMVLNKNHVQSQQVLHIKGAQKEFQNGLITRNEFLYNQKTKTEATRSGVANIPKTPAKSSLAAKYYKGHKDRKTELAIKEGRHLPPQTPKPSTATTKEPPFKTQAIWATEGSTRPGTARPPTSRPTTSRPSTARRSQATRDTTTTVALSNRPNTLIDTKNRHSQRRHEEMYKKSQDAFREIYRDQCKEDTKAELKEMLTRHLGNEGCRYAVIQAQKHQESLKEAIDRRAKEMRDMNDHFAQTRKSVRQLENYKEIDKFNAQFAETALLNHTRIQYDRETGNGTILTDFYKSDKSNDPTTFKDKHAKSYKDFGNTDLNQRDLDDLF